MCVCVCVGACVHVCGASGMQDVHDGAILYSNIISCVVVCLNINLLNKFAVIACP